MSKSKAVQVYDQILWCFDDALHVVLAHMADAAASTVAESTVEAWRRCASIRDVGVEISPTEVERPEILGAIREAQRRIEAIGDVTGSDVAKWIVLDDVPLGGDGELRIDPLPVASLLEVVLGLLDRVEKGDSEDDEGETDFGLLGFPGRIASDPG